VRLGPDFSRSHFEQLQRDVILAAAQIAGRLDRKDQRPVGGEVAAANAEGALVLLGVKPLGIQRL
jgi:hypothetical protein